MTRHYKSLWSSPKCWGEDWVDSNGNFSVWYQYLIEMPNSAIELALLKTFNGAGKPPTPSEFLLMSKFEPEDIGAPALNLAYMEACKGGIDIFMAAKADDVITNTTVGHKWSHAAVYHAQKFENFRFLRGDSKKAAFKNSYLSIVERIGNGEEFEAPPETLYLEDKQKIKGFNDQPETNRNKAKKHLNTLKSLDYSVKK